MTVETPPGSDDSQKSKSSWLRAFGQLVLSAIVLVMFLDSLYLTALILGSRSDDSVQWGFELAKQGALSVVFGLAFAASTYFALQYMRGKL